MARFEGKPSRIPRPASEILSKFDDLTNLQQYIDMLPEKEREKAGQVSFGTDTIVLHTGQVGDVTLRISERTPSSVKFSAVSAPVPVDMYVNVKALDNTSSEVTTAIELQIPMMLKPMVAPHMQKAVDMLSDMIAKIGN